jgi:hypothetical protein
VYTPPLPSSAGILFSQEDNNEIMGTYLANQIPPSQIEFEENAYILNISDEIGGYIDASACVLHKDRRLDDSPSACGHLINHNGKIHANVKVVSFYWKDILGEENNNEDDEQWYKLPNILRFDGSPWYFDTINQQIQYFPKGMQDHRFATMNHQMVVGAAIIADDTSNVKLIPGQELFLDYQLKATALPKWAVDWYHK